MAHVNRDFVETCTVLFQRADDDGNGYLDPEEFAAVLRSRALNLQLSAEEIEEAVAQADKDGDGEITLEEFIPMVERLFYRKSSTVKTKLHKKHKKLHSTQSGRAGNNNGGGGGGVGGDHSSGGNGSEMARSGSGSGGDSNGKGTTKSMAWRGWGRVSNRLLGQRTSIADPSTKFDFASVAVLAARANNVREADVFRIRREGCDAMYQGQLMRAEKLLRCSHAMSKRLKRGSGGWHRSACAYALGELMLRYGRPDEAVPLLEECLAQRKELRKSAAQSTTNDCLMLLCIACSRAGRHSDAELWARRLITEHGATSASSSAGRKRLQSGPQAKQFWRALAESLLAQEKYEDTAYVQHVRLNSARTSFEANQKQANTVLNALGFVYDVLGGQGGSEIETRCRQRALMALTKQHRGRLSMAKDDTIIHGNTMYSLARLLLQQGQPLEAQPLMEQALCIFEKIHGKSHPRVAFALTTLASCLASQPGKQRKGLRLLDRSIRILSTHFGPEGVQVAEPGGPLLLKAKIQEMMGQLNTCRRTLRQMLGKLQKHYGKEDTRCLDIAAEMTRMAGLMRERKTQRSLRALHKMEERISSGTRSCRSCGQVLRLEVTGCQRVCGLCLAMRRLQTLQKSRVTEAGVRGSSIDAWRRQANEVSTAVSEAVAALEAGSSERAERGGSFRCLMEQ